MTIGISTPPFRSNFYRSLKVVKKLFSLYAIQVQSGISIQVKGGKIILIQVKSKYNYQKLRVKIILRQILGW